MKQVQIEHCSSINAIKLRQDIKKATSSSVFEKIKENISTDFDINVDTPKKEIFNDQKNENKDNINKLNDINIKLSYNNNSPNKCKATNANFGISSNKSNNNPIKIKDNKVITKFNNDGSNVSNKINDNNNNTNNCNNNYNNNNDNNNSDTTTTTNNNNNNNNNKYNINENDNNLATNDNEKSITITLIIKQLIIKTKVTLKIIQGKNQFTLLGIAW